METEMVKLPPYEYPLREPTRGHDAGLVERAKHFAHNLSINERGISDGTPAFIDELATALEAKDAEIATLHQACNVHEKTIGKLNTAWDEAQAEIERLKKAYPFKAWAKQKEEAQAEIERLRKPIMAYGSGGYAGTLEAENERLREALQKIEELTSPHIGPNQDATTAFMLARAALKAGRAGRRKP
jgi:chromosome segregation ATPase